MHTIRHPKQRGFTLIELLVVIAVIALLISILLPSLSSARKVGRGVVCQSNMRGFLTNLSGYFNDNKEYIPGPNTSGARLTSVANYVSGAATPMQDWDYISPAMGDALNFSPDRLNKYQDACMTRFRCPENTVRYKQAYSVDSDGQLPMVDQTGEHPLILSYMTPAYFHVYPQGTFIPGFATESLTATEPISLPRGYKPRLDRVGQQLSKKAMAFEGARYWNAPAGGTEGYFDYSLNVNTSGLVGSPQGNFSSRGPAFNGGGEGYERVNGAPSSMMMKTTLRHVKKMNIAMLDAHVETLDNAGSADPKYYVPSGSRVRTPGGFWLQNISPDAWARYADSPIID